MRIPISLIVVASVAIALAVAGCGTREPGSGSGASSGSTGSTGSSEGSTGQGSGSTGGSSGTTTGSGPIGTADVTVGDGSAYGTNLSAVIYPGDAGFDPANLEVVIGDASACRYTLAQETGNAFSGNLDFIRIHLSGGDGGAVVPGTYALDGSTALVAWTAFNFNGDNGGGGTTLLSVGALTLAEVGPSGISGSFDAHVADGGSVTSSIADHLTGTFSAGACP